MAFYEGKASCVILTFCFIYWGSLGAAAFTLPPQNSSFDFDDYGEVSTKKAAFFLKIEEEIRNHTQEIARNKTCADNECDNEISNATQHAPLFGFIPRDCPTEALTDAKSVKQCTSDDDCWPRVCCYEGGGNEVAGYCRLAMPIWDRSPMARVMSPFKSAMAYWECTPPPPPEYDFLPKQCKSTFDCFPNLCCPENNLKVCRPPRRSLLTLISNLAERETWFG